MGKVDLFDQSYKLYTIDWGSFMVALSFSEAIMTGLEQERAEACKSAYPPRSGWLAGYGRLKDGKCSLRTGRLGQAVPVHGYTS